MCAKVRTLNHEVGYDPMKETSSITKALFVSTKCNEVFHRFWYSFSKQTNLYASNRLIADRNVKVYLRTSIYTHTHQNKVWVRSQ